MKAHSYIMAVVGAASFMATAYVLRSPWAGVAFIGGGMVGACAAYAYSSAVVEQALDLVRGPTGRRARVYDVAPGTHRPLCPACGRPSTLNWAFDADQCLPCDRWASKPCGDPECSWCAELATFERPSMARHGGAS